MRKEQKNVKKIDTQLSDIEQRRMEAEDAFQEEIRVREDLAARVGGISVVECRQTLYDYFIPNWT